MGFEAKSLECLTSIYCTKNEPVKYIIISM